jgi:predicted phosphoribosyltransferase
MDAWAAASGIRYGKVMNPLFRNRTEAGEILAERLLRYSHRPGVIVLALPRGGVPVGVAIARRLELPLDVLIVRKLGVPGYWELAMGAVSSGGIRVLNERVITEHAIPQSTTDALTARETEELQRREELYRGGRAQFDLANRTVILTDDGVATGSTVRAAIEVLRREKAKRIVVAVPTIARDTFHEIRGMVDECEAIIVPERFESVGEWYENFAQLTDDQVRELLASAANPPESRPGAKGRNFAPRKP